jgi:hypothetical protein
MKLKCPITNELCDKGCTPEVCSGSPSCLKTAVLEETITINNPPVPPAGGMMGWICPRCGKGNSPFSSTCPCITTYPVYPVNPFYPNYPTVPYNPYPVMYWTSSTISSNSGNNIKS